MRLRLRNARGLVIPEGRGLIDDCSCDPCDGTSGNVCDRPDGACAPFSAVILDDGPGFPFDCFYPEPLSGTQFQLGLFETDDAVEIGVRNFPSDIAVDRMYRNRWTVEGWYVERITQPGAPFATCHRLTSAVLTAAAWDVNPLNGVIVTAVTGFTLTNEPGVPYVPTHVDVNGFEFPLGPVTLEGQMLWNGGNLIRRAYANGQLVFESEDGQQTPPDAYCSLAIGTIRYEQRHEGGCQVVPPVSDWPMTAEFGGCGFEDV